MATTERPPGKTTIAPEVLATIIRLTALQVDGVSRLAQIPSSMNTLFSRNREDGVEITVKEDRRVYADLHLILTDKALIRETSKKVQDEVSEAISKMVGMDVNLSRPRQYEGSNQGPWYGPSSIV